MTIRSILFASTITATIFAANLNASFIVSETFDSDAEFLALFGGGAGEAIATKGVAQGRFGNNGLSGDHEFDLGPSTSAPVDSDQFVWPNGSSVKFSLDFDTSGSSPVITSVLDVDNVTGNKRTQVWNPASINRFESIAMRVRSEIGTSSLLLNNIFLNGHSAGSLLSDTADKARYLVIDDSTSDLYADGFSLTGDATFTWQSGTKQSGSRLAYQFKMIDYSLEPVPEPSEIALAAIPCLMAFIGIRRKIVRRRQTAKATAEE